MAAFLVDLLEIAPSVAAFLVDLLEIAPSVAAFLVDLFEIAPSMAYLCPLLSVSGSGASIYLSLEKSHRS